MKKFLVAAGVLVSVVLAFGIYRQMTIAKNVVVVYSPHANDFLDEINRMFEAQYSDITVQVIKGGTTHLEDRIRSEKSNPMGDVMFGGDTGTFIQMKNAGLLQPFPLSVADKIAAGMKDADHYWFAPYQLPGVFFYNNKLVTAAEAPKDWDDFLKPEWKDAIMILNPTQSGTARACFIALVVAWGHDKAFDYFQKLDTQLGGQYVGASEKMLAAITRGEAKIGIWNEYSILKSKLRKNMPFDIIYPASGTYMNPDAIGIIAGAPHLEAAQKYVEFIFATPTLEMAAQNYMRRPTVAGFPKDRLPEVIRSEPKTFKVDWAAIGDKGSAWLKEWSEEVWHKNQAHQS